MDCLRYFVLIFTFVAFLLALIGTMKPPIFTGNFNKYNQTLTVQMNFFDAHIGEVKLNNYSQIYTFPSQLVRFNYYWCNSFKTAVRCMEAFALAGVVFSGTSFLMSLLQCFCKKKVKLPLMIFCVLGFLCELILVIVVASVYAKSYCAHDAIDSNGTMINLKNDGYSFAYAFYLHIIALVLLFLSLILCPFTQDLWCGKK